MIKQNIKFYAEKFFELLKKEFENNISYRYKLLFLKNEEYNQYSVCLAIDTNNDSSKNKIAYYTYKDFMKLEKEKQLEFVGNFYNAEIIGKKENEFGIEDVNKDFLHLCNFNYLRDNKEIEDKEEDSL